MPYTPVRVTRVQNAQTTEVPVPLGKILLNPLVFRKARRFFNTFPFRAETRWKNADCDAQASTSIVIE
ncbi:MAG TPA: hypothetical protein DD670_12860 [Planctomycetaceae bacterium]|nr:hypothetical protein [Planctomycetaceae bacterium]